jgi:hypothetical protein
MPGARARHQAGGSKALGGQKRLCAAAKALGGGTQFWLGEALQAPLKGLRASGFDSHWHALAGLRDPHALLSIRQKLITGSRGDIIPERLPLLLGKRGSFEVTLKSR